MIRWIWQTYHEMPNLGTTFQKKGGFASWLFRLIFTPFQFPGGEVHLTIISAAAAACYLSASREPPVRPVWGRNVVGRGGRGAGVMAFSGLRQLANMKLKDVPSFVRSSANREYVAQKTWGFLNNYNERYIKTSSIRPLNDVLISVFIISYAIGWPTEIRHLHHAEEAAKHGKNKKHWRHFAHTQHTLHHHVHQLPHTRNRSPSLVVCCHCSEVEELEYTPLHVLWWGHFHYDSILHFHQISPYVYNTLLNLGYKVFAWYWECMKIWVLLVLHSPNTDKHEQSKAFWKL